MKGKSRMMICPKKNYHVRCCICPHAIKHKYINYRKAELYDGGCDCHGCIPIRKEKIHD
jgi:hypothetical protein